MEYKKVYGILLRDNGVINGYCNDVYTSRETAESALREMNFTLQSKGEIVEFILNMD